MPQPKKGARLGSNPSHQRRMLSNLALSLFEHEQIKTTEAKAKLLRPFAERLITKAKTGDIHKRRQVLSTIENREMVHKLFADIAPRFADRNGGYTRILKLGPRNGDGAPMALIELVEGAAPAHDDDAGETEAATRRRLGRRPRGRQTSATPDKPVRTRATDAAEAGAGAGTAAAGTQTPAGSETVSETETEAGPVIGINDDIDQADTGKPGQPFQTGAGGKEADPES